jgi:hypothetical protein
VGLTRDVIPVLLDNMSQFLSVNSHIYQYLCSNEG